MRICGGQSTEWSAKIANFVKLEPSVFWVNMSNCQQVNQNIGMVLRSFTINELHFASCVWLGWWCGVHSFYPLIIYFIFLIFEPQNRKIHMLMSHILQCLPRIESSLFTFAIMFCSKHRPFRQSMLCVRNQDYGTSLAVSSTDTHTLM